jgi:hypothetical protein
VYQYINLGLDPKKMQAGAARSLRQYDECQQQRNIRWMFNQIIILCKEMKLTRDYGAGLFIEHADRFGLVRVLQAAVPDPYPRKRKHI